MAELTVSYRSVEVSLKVQEEEYTMLSLGLSWEGRPKKKQATLH
jgi:hypothetical protein